jgi:hypothetical protein
MHPTLEEIMEREGEGHLKAMSKTNEEKDREEKER